MRAKKIADQKTDETHWLLKRFELVTGSDVATILGLNKYMDWETLLEEKANRYSNYLHFKHSDRGHDNEQTILDLYRKKTGARSRRLTGLWQSQDYPWLGASPDSIALKNSESKLVEVKAPSRHKEDGAEVYVAQTLLQMVVLGVESADVVIGIPTLEWIDAFDEPEGPLSYVDYMVACGLPYYSFRDGMFVDPIFQPKARIVYNDIEIVTVTKTKSAVDLMLSETKDFYDELCLR